MPQEVIIALQHYPQYIEQMLFSFGFKFEEIADGELYLHELDWKGNPKYMRWFHRMGDFPLSLFLSTITMLAFMCLPVTCSLTGN